MVVITVGDGFTKKSFLKGKRFKMVNFKSKYEYKGLSSSTDSVLPESLRYGLGGDPQPGIKFKYENEGSTIQEKHLRTMRNTRSVNSQMVS